MAAIEIRKAERVKSKLRLGLAGPAGSGKTMSALKVAKGLGGNVCLIDTERGSGDLYADLYDYSVITLEPPFKPDILIEAIHAAEKAGFNVIIIDSLSHFWADEGGLLDQVDKIAKDSKNSYTAWKDITPQHRRLIGTMLNSPKHIIATVRSKQAYELETYTDRNGEKKQRPVKIGLAPVQREGLEYEFTIFFDINQEHYARPTKDRTNMFKDEVIMLDEQTGVRIMEWLNSGKDDVNAMKREVLGQLERLEIAVPKENAKEFIPTAVKKLTGLEWNQENLKAIIATLIDIEDKKKAYDIVFETGKVEEAKAA